MRQALGAQAEALPAGGSPARLWLTEPSPGERVVVKVLYGRDGIVDGHDLDSFVLKPQQIRAVHRRLPVLSPHYVRTIGEWRGPGWAAYAMPYHAGEPLTVLLDRPDADLPAFTERLRTILRPLSEHGYAADRQPAPPDHFGTTHVDRLRRRLPLLAQHLDPALFTADRVTVNGRSCRTVPRLIDALADDRLARLMRPGRLSFPLHGDLILGNLLVDADRFLVLDPRGTLQPWDPVYDLAKSLFSLTVFEQAIAGGFVVRRSTGSLDEPRYEVSLRAGRATYLTAAAQFVPLLEGLPFAAELDRDDPDWRTRLLVVHAVHCLAEAACRLSDRKHREYGDVHGWDACRMLATGLCLVALMLLEELVSTGASVTARTHLGWLGPELVRTAGPHSA
ncbi:phosphotransferase [Micromonospora pallida]|uniref:phosphotransferase n=1 Tax=Micromonospora pallida TaxID=145854 RepID=UPI00159EFDD4|nr:phosphotransferase [Micromonospora pallida]